METSKVGQSPPAMRHPKHSEFLDALRQFAAVRSLFGALADEDLILGNDNHIGVIGEYWAHRYYEQLGPQLPGGVTGAAPVGVLSRGTKIAKQTSPEGETESYPAPFYFIPT